MTEATTIERPVETPKKGHRMAHYYCPCGAVEDRDELGGFPGDRTLCGQVKKSPHTPGDLPADTTLCVVCLDLISGHQICVHEWLWRHP